MYRRLLVFTAFLAACASAQAEGMKVTPGLWEMTSTISMPMAPKPRTMSSEQCFEESEVTPETFGDESFNHDCTFEVDHISSTEMEWTFDCQVQDGSTSGTWQASSTGETITGKGDMAMSMPSQDMEMTMSMEWSGKRVGDCPAQ